jgi:serine phosphatase RsbU (regulator of sigma subunit)
MLRSGQIAPGLSGDTSVPVGLGLRQATVGSGRLEPGDALLFYSDGVVEARSDAGDEFGVDRLADLFVRAAASREPPPEIVRRLTHAVLDHEEGYLEDDATLLLVEWPTR